MADLFVVKNEGSQLFHLLCVAFGKLLFLTEPQLWIMIVVTSQDKN